MHLFIPAFFAGFATFFAPCTLPLVPAYIALVSDLSDKKMASPGAARSARRTIWLNSLCFIVGFSTVFVSLGTLAGVLGGALPLTRIWLARIGGTLVALLGLSMLGILNIPFLETRRQILHPNLTSKSASPFRSFSFGAAFAFGWSPCIGPILASILLFASQSSTAQTGTLLLLVFSLGLALPFLFITATINSAALHSHVLTAFLVRLRVPILALGGAAVGFLGNVVLVALTDLLERLIGRSLGLTTLAMSIFIAIPYILPAVGAALLGYSAYRNREIAIVATIGGFFLLFIGILLATGNFAVLTQYTYDAFRLFNYDRLLEYL